MPKSTVAILLLLMLAIPFQGLASALQSGCALGHHRPAPDAPISHQHSGHDGHAAMHSGAAQADTPADSDAGPATECECASCTVAAALPFSTTEVTGVLSEPSPLGRFANPPITLLTGGPERPPRTVLA